MKSTSRPELNFHFVALRRASRATTEGGMACVGDGIELLFWDLIFAFPPIIPLRSFFLATLFFICKSVRPFVHPDTLAEIV